MGQGVNYVTATTRAAPAASGWRTASIAYPVHEITIAGNLKDMLRGIEAVGADALHLRRQDRGRSILINRMKVAGS